MSERVRIAVTIIIFAVWVLGFLIGPVVIPGYDPNPVWNALFPPLLAYIVLNGAEKPSEGAEPVWRPKPLQPAASPAERHLWAMEHQELSAEYMAGVNHGRGCPVCKTHEQ